MEQIKGYVMIALAGCLWGTLGLFGKLFFSFEFNPQLVVFCRLFGGFSILFLFILFKNRSLLKIDKKGLKYTALIGLFSQALFNLLYFQSIQRTTISTAVVLLYTAPIFLIIMGRVFYKETVTSAKVVALFLCVVGCFLTVTGGNLEGLNVNMIGVLMGIGAGFMYSLVTIISKAIINEYHPFTIIMYSFLFGWIFLLPFSHPLDLLYVKYSVPIVASIVGIGLVPTVLSYMLYITGLSYGVEASKAGIICSTEIIVSVLISCIVFKEVIVGFKLLGIIMALASIVMVQLGENIKFINKPKEAVGESL